LKKGRAKTESKGQKKAKHEEEKQGIMRDIDDREQLAKKLEEGVERKPQERRSPGSGMGVNMVDMIDMIKSSRGIKWRFTKQQIIKACVKKKMFNITRCDLRKGVMWGLSEGRQGGRDWEVQEARSLWEETNAGVLRDDRQEADRSEVGWHQQRDAEKPESRCRLVASEINTDRGEGLFAATPPVKAKKILFVLRTKGEEMRFYFVVCQGQEKGARWSSGIG
jgi:hypothetical protein